MTIFDQMTSQEHEQVVFCHDKATGLKAIIAIHDTTLGPALGGLRMWPYEKDEDALFDVLRLSKGMTYKNAAAGLNLGGGKAVIIGDPQLKSEALFRSFGRFVQSLGGRYITAEDVNTNTDDMMFVHEETDFVSGLPESVGGSGDPSPFTALGTFEGIKSAVSYRLKKESLSGVTVAVQGLGSVGTYLCEMLHNAGAKLIVSDMKQAKVDHVVKKFSASSVKLDDIYSVDADVFAPCALGAIVNDKTIDQFKFKVIAGAANNQLLDEKKHGKILKDKNILYAPDYIINSGGVINVYYEVIGEYVRENVTKKVENIYKILTEIFKISDDENIPTYIASSRFSERRIEQIGKVQRTYLG
ncbi:MAG: Glu/Leu/Phe/Val dehydrogenase [Calditrichaeota bacterium]|nr:Glu/Leu/Phe/Val dehydrogenase [Calditrichota bacterium]